MRRNWFRIVLDAVLPPKDDVRVAESLSEEELLELFHPRLGKEAWITAFFPYTSAPVRSLVRAVKFYGVTGPLPMVGRITGEYILEIISDKQTMAGWTTPLLVPIPSSESRLKERGYNQAARFAEAMMPVLDSSVSYAPHALARENRESQVRIERTKRGKNIQGAFFVPNPETVSGRQVILIDDVVESAATMKDARRALIGAGASQVIGFAITH